MPDSGNTLTTPPLTTTPLTTPPQFDAVLFDLDGTLIDTAPDFITVVNQLRQEENLPPLSDEAIRKTVSNGARALVSLAFGLSEDEEEFEPLRLRLLDLYINNLSVDSCLFNGGDRLIKILNQKHIPWGIVTNKPSTYTTPLLQDLGLKCGSVVCPDHVDNRKPHPEPMLKAASELNVQHDRCIYVGDHRRDIEAGKSAGMITIAALYGYIEDDDDPRSWNADYYVNSIDEITALLFQHYNQ